MEDNTREQIKKVRISDVEQPEDGSAAKELDRAQLDKVSGGGEYGWDDSSGS